MKGLIILKVRIMYHTGGETTDRYSFDKKASALPAYQHYIISFLALENLLMSPASASAMPLALGNVACAPYPLQAGEHKRKADGLVLQSSDKNFTIRVVYFLK